MFTVYAVIVLPDGSMLDALTLRPNVRPLASNVNGLPEGFVYTLMNLRIPAGAPPGNYILIVGFFDPKAKITGPQDAFLLVQTPFNIK